MTQVKLKAADGRVVDATELRTWRREEAPSAEGSTFRAMAGALFGRGDAVTRVMLLRDRAVLLFLYEAAHRWFDVRGGEVEVTKCRV